MYVLYVYKAARTPGFRVEAAGTSGLSGTDKALFLWSYLRYSRWNWELAPIRAKDPTAADKGLNPGGRRIAAECGNPSAKAQFA